MTNKVKLTREQADAIESFTLTNNTLEGFSRNRKAFRNSFKPIKDFTVDKLAKALYIGYETEIEDGDWVVRTRGLNDNNLYKKGRIFKVKKVLMSEFSHSIVTEVSNDVEHLMKSLRHATSEEIAEEKERRWWEKHGRDPWELKEDDILYYDGHIFAVTASTDEHVYLHGKGNHCHIARSTIKSKYAVACFTEDRKDVEHGE